ncbi:MAG: anti-sigma factor family protein [Anaerolineae bacterium]
MSCRETTVMMIAYLDQELSPSERQRMAAHLAGCDTCRRELETLSTVQGRVRRSLHQQAAQAVPAPEAWVRLQDALAGAHRPVRHVGTAGVLQSIVLSIRTLFLGGSLMRRFALVCLLTLALLGGVVIAVPPVRAQVQEMIDAWFHFQLPGGRSGVGIGFGGARHAFRPYLPAWLPEGLDLGLTGGTTAPGAEYVEFEFHPMPPRKGDDRFIRLIEGKGEAVPGLPEGRAVTVKGQRAVFTSELSERHEIQVDPPTPDGARVLAWYVGEIKMELVSNLPEEEMVAVAESLVPMEEGKGE